MELRTLNTFLLAAELGSFSQAAKLLSYSQSTVTMQIQQLENELGVRLFDRIGRRVSTTPAGEKLTGYARTMLQIEEQAKSDLQQGEVRGKLRIALAESLCSVFFPRLVEQYHALCPQVQLELHRGGQDELFQMLNHNETDMVYTLDAPIYRGNLEKVLNAQEEVFFVAAATHPLANRRQIPLEQLLEQEFILTEKGMSYRDQLDRFLSSRSLELQPYLELGDIVLIRQMVEMNLGVSLLPGFAVEEGIRTGRLVRLDVPECHITCWRQLLRRKDKYVTPQMQAFFQLIQAESGETEGE